MNKIKENQPIPKWFNGEIYGEGAVVKNPFSGDTCKLNAKELSMYDFVVGANRVLEMLYDNKAEPNDRIEKLYDDLYKGLDWFKKYNAKAYMILLD